MAVSVIATQTFSDEHRRGPGGARRCRPPLFCTETIGPGAAVKRWPCRVLRFRGVAERGWSSASRARPRSVGCAILSESLRPALADQLVDQFAVASSVSERATQLLGCGAPLCGRGVGRVRRPGHDLIVAGGGAANRRSRTRPLASCCVPSLRALPLDEACELRICPDRWRSLAPGKESVARRSLACLTAMQQLGVLGGFPEVARETADVPDHGRVRVAGENTMLRDAELRSFAPGARVMVIPQHVEKARTRWCGRSA